MRRAYRTTGGSLVAHDQGAHLTEWVVGDTAVIWASQASEYAEGRAIRGGVPVCWPWFAAGRSGDVSPAHGFARVAPWRLVEEAVDQHSVVLAWELTGQDVRGLDGSDLFPHEFRARLQVQVAEAATISLTVRNEDRAPFSYEAALHTYLHVGDIREARVVGLDGADYYDKVDQQERTQTGDIRFVGETDRVYTADGPVRVQDPVLERTLLIEKSGSPNTVVWNPWVDKGAAMSDFGDDEWPLMVCVEAASVGDRAVVLEPGAEHTLSTRVRVLDESGS
ncbi:D-hexose-6-phosphate mutarotase [Ornithinimicrobium sp. F0845]|uniref:D-hexose-6-phosphate mutarotase n=1 Tax=Ornithinimicrobium sp. F0845 TaxID=2926412 RepID=UPI001FF4424D|nr:D-hexose-6-phosphate mutarotase [Ornithinimicrobium sp. F0845]MCK0113214.1 D-hexose-6-phosphate mutarotase [Ornithinimicrobium sp. F0845]